MADMYQDSVRGMTLPRFLVVVRLGTDQPGPKLIYAETLYRRHVLGSTDFVDAMTYVCTEEFFLVVVPISLRSSYIAVLL